MIDGFGNLTELYNEVILDHAGSPRNFRENLEAGRKAEGYNPLCGDQITVYCLLEGEKLVDLSFTGKGCAICTASASIMTQTLKSKQIAKAQNMFERFHKMLLGEGGEDELGKLSVFAGVHKYPARVKCATLPWHTLQSSLKEGDRVSTE